MKKILLVEDDPFLSSIYKEKLERKGFEVEIAETGRKAIEQLLKKNYPLLILDLVLPDIDGWEVLEKVNELKKKNLKDLKIVILSNLADKEIEKKSLSFGVDSFLLKAKFTPSEVVKEIKKFL